MSFLESAGGEVIGGIVGGLVVVFATSLWYTFRTFQLHYLNPLETITAEHMREYTAVRVEPGRCRFRIRLRPRIGVDLERYSFAFFDRGKLPWLVGRRRSTDNAKIYEMRYFSSNSRNFVTVDLRIFDNEGSHAQQPSFSLPSGSCTYFELCAEISNTLESWEGILSYQIHYQRDGNPEKRNVRTKFFVRAAGKRRPFRALLKKVLTAEPIESGNDKKGFQP